MLKDLWPDKKQYQQWSMPSKLTFIGTYVGLLSLVLAIATLIVTSIIKYRLDDIVIQGKWDVEQATEVVINSVKKYGGVDEFGFNCPGGDGNCEVEHELIDFYFVKYAQTTSIVALVYTGLKGYDCRACLVNISAFEFEELPKGWKIKNAYINAIETGGWGRPPELVRVISIGYDIFGIVTDFSDMQHGIHFTITNIYTPIAGGMKKVFNEFVRMKTPTGNEPEYDHRGKVIGYSYRPNWSSKITMLPHGTSYYDLKIEYFGETTSDEKDKVYRFDGHKYSSENAFN